MPAFPYRTAETEFIPCNQCGASETETLHSHDRNGLPVRSCICKRCGLIYLNPRMTPRWYDEYYKSEYRPQMARFKGKRPNKYNPAAMFENSTRHGTAIATRFQSFWAKGAILEVGSSVGGVLNGLRERLGYDVVGIEPSPIEAQEANSRGIRTWNSAIESLREAIPPAGNILCTQSLNHLLDPKFFLQWAHQHLIPGGRLFLEVMNFRHVFRHFRWMQRAIQIDHTYMFVPEVLQSFVEFAGFQVLNMEADEDKCAAELKRKKEQGLPVFHVALIAERTNMPPFTDLSRLRELFPHVRTKLDQIPNSRWNFLWRFRALPRLRKIGLAPELK